MTPAIFSWIFGIAGGLMVILLGIIGYLLKMHNTNVMARIDHTDSEVAALRKDLEEKIIDSNTKVLEAIKEQASSSVHVDNCKNTQRLWDERFESWFKMQDLKQEIDKKEHASMSSTMKGILDHLSSISDCLTDIQNDKDCTK